MKGWRDKWQRVMFRYCVKIRDFSLSCYDLFELLDNCNMFVATSFVALEEIFQKCSHSDM